MKISIFRVLIHKPIYTWVGSAVVLRVLRMLPTRSISYLSPMCFNFWEKCTNSHKTGLGCSTPLKSHNFPPCPSYSALCWDWQYHISPCCLVTLYETQHILVGSFSGCSAEGETLSIRHRPVQLQVWWLHLCLRSC